MLFGARHARKEAAVKPFAMFLALAIAAVATIAASQEAGSKSAASPEATKPITVSGEIVQYDAGKTIVLRQADDAVVRYALSPTLVVPVDVQIGRRVLVVAEAGADGIVRVTRITNLPAEGATAGTQATQTTTAYTHETAKPVETKIVTVTGDVVRYEAGKTIVVRNTEGREVTYTIAPQVSAPAEVVVGRRVAIVTEPSGSGPVLVTRITMETMSPEGTVQTKTEKTEIAPSGTETKTQITSVYGTVSAYEPGRSITLLRPNATTVTYTIDSSSSVPSSLGTGRKVVIRTITRPGLERPIVRKVTYSKSTKKTKTVQ